MPTVDYLLEEKRRKEGQAQQGLLSPARRILQAVRSVAGQVQQAVTGQPTTTQAPPAPALSAPPQATTGVSAGLPGIAPRVIQGVQQVAGQVQQAASPRFILGPASVPARVQRGVAGVAAQVPGLGYLSESLRRQWPRVAPEQRAKEFRTRYAAGGWEGRQPRFFLGRGQGQAGEMGLGEQLERGVTRPHEMVGPQPYAGPAARPATFPGPVRKAMEIANVPAQAVGRELEPIRQLTLALASPGFTTEEKRAILKSFTETRSVGWLASDEGKARLQEAQYIEPQGKLENLISTAHDLSIMEGTAITDPLNLVPVLGFTKMDDLVTAARVLSRLGKTPAIRESAEVLAREAAAVGAREAAETGAREAAPKAPRFVVRPAEAGPPSAGRAVEAPVAPAVEPAARPPEFGAVRQPEGLNPPPLELRSPEGRGGLFEVPEAADWQAAIDARDAAQLPPMGGGAMPATYQWRGVAPAVVRPTKGLWAAVTNTVRTARGLPRLTETDFLRQAEASATVGNYGKGIEEASRVSQQAVNDYRKIVPEPPRLKPTGGNDAPQGLVGSELDILERPQAYKGGDKLGLAREWWQEYGRMDLADLQQRGIPVSAYDDYVFQHRYGDYFRKLGITDTSGASASLRSRMPMQQGRQFTTAYDAWKASEGGIAVAADKDGVLHAKFLAKGNTVKVGDTIQVGTRKAFGKEYPIMGTVERIGDPLLPAVTDANALVASRFEQSALLRAQKDLFDSARDSAFNIARKGVPQGYKTLNNLPGPLADLKLLVPDGAGNTRLVSVRKLAWPTKTADALQGLLAPERLPTAAQGLTNAVAVLRDIRLNLDPSMITLIFSRYPLGHPITFLRNAREFGAVMRSESAWRQFMAEDPMVRRFIDGGGGGLFQRMEYMTGEAKPLVERFARIPHTPIALQSFNEETMRVIGYGTVKTAQVNEQVLRAVRAGMKLSGADKLNIPLTRIARMTDQEILEASVKSAMDQFGKLRYNDLGMSQWGKAAWRNTILTPGFLKTHISLLANSPKAFLGNPEGILGLVFLTQYVGITLGIAEGLSRISGFHTSADPRNLNFGGIRTPFGTFSTMGQIRTYMRLFANLPSDLHAGYYDRLYRSGLSRLGIVPNELAMQIKGEEYFGEPMGGPGQRLLSAGVRSLPIGFQTPIEIAMGKEQAIDPVLSSFADWSGASFWPRRTLDLLDDEMRKPVSQGGYGIGWWDAEPWQRQELEDRHPELQGRLGEEQKMAARRGVQSAQYGQRIDEVTAPYDEQLKQAVATLSGPDLRSRYNDIQAQRQAAMRAVETDPRFAEYTGRREERNAATLAEAQTLRAAGKPLEAKHLLAEYGAIFDRHEGDPDPTAMFDELDRFWAGLKPGEEKQLTDNLGLSLPPEIQAMRKELRTLKPYWDKADEAWAAARRLYAEAAPYETVDDYRTAVERRMVELGLYGTQSADSFDPILKTYNSGLSMAHQVQLIRDPRMNAVLTKWYGNVAKTWEAQQIAQATAEEQYGTQPQTSYGLQPVGVGP